MDVPRCYATCGLGIWPCRPLREFKLSPKSDRLRVVLRSGRPDPWYPSPPLLWTPRYIHNRFDDSESPILKTHVCFRAYILLQSILSDKEARKAMTDRFEQRRGRAEYCL